MYEGVPAHDIRDWHFAKQHHIEIVTVVVPSDQKGFLSKLFSSQSKYVRYHHPHIIFRCLF